MTQLTETFWTFAGSAHTYFVTTVSAEVRDTSARWVGSRGGGSSFGKLYFQDLDFPDWCPGPPEWCSGPPDRQSGNQTKIFVHEPGTRASCFQILVVPFFLRQLRELALPEPPRSLLLVGFVATVPQSRYAAVSW